MGALVAHSPFLLKIDRKSDVGRSDFQYRYAFLLGGSAVSIDRVGYYMRRSGRAEIFSLDFQMYSLVEAMDTFNILAPEDKTPQTSWLTFAKVKGCAREVGASLDSTLAHNDVIVPSSLGLDMREDEDGALTFLPKCPELASEDFQQVFERNSEAERLYSLDRPGLGRIRIVLTDQQQEVLRRMKRVRRIKGTLKDRLMQDPVQVFDGIADHVDLPYGERVIGIGDFAFSPTPRPTDTESTMANLWQAEDTASEKGIDNERKAHGETSEPIPTEHAETGPAEESGVIAAGSRPDDSEANPTGSMAEGEAPTSEAIRKKYLLIETNEAFVNEGMISGAQTARHFFGGAPYERPHALREDRHLRPRRSQSSAGGTERSAPSRDAGDSLWVGPESQ